MNIFTSFKRGALALMVGASCLLANAATVTFVHDGIIYKTGTTAAKATQLTVQKPGTTLTDKTQTPPAQYSGDIVLPATIEQNGTTYTVVDVAAAFMGQPITSVVLPETVTETKRDCFANCTSLTKVTLPKTLVTLGQTSFAGCTALTELIIPGKVTEFTRQQIKGCTGLQRLVFEDGETPLKITYDGFGQSSNGSLLNSCWEVLSYVELNRAINESGLTNASQPFRNAKSLTTLVLGGHFNKIPAAMCQGSRKLASIIFNSEVTDFGANAFERTAFSEFTFPDGTETIPSSIFTDCPNLVKVTLPSTVTSIQGMAFQRSELSEINFPDKLASIATLAFESTRLGGELSLPASLTTLGTQAFANNSAITSVNINAALRDFGDGVFAGCSKLSVITAPADAENFATAENGAMLTSKDGKILYMVAPGAKLTELAGDFTEVKARAAYKKTDLAKISLPACVQWGDRAFMGTGITELAVRGTVGRNVAAECTGLETLSIDSDEVPEGIALGATALTKVTLLQPVTTVKAHAFEGCTALKEVDLGNILAIIEADAFLNSGIKSITVGAARPAAMSDGVFDESFADVTARVPAAYAEAYRNASGWKFLNIVGDENVAAGPSDMGMPAGIYFAGTDGHIYGTYDKDRTEFTRYDVGGVEHTFQLREFKNRIYGASAGKKFWYSATAATEGDGKLFYISQIGGQVFKAVVLDNAGNNAYMDPTSIDVYGDMLYVNDRNVCIRKIPADAISLPQDYPSWMENNWMGWYGNGWSYGCIKAGWAITQGENDKGEAVPEYWVGMKYNGEGIYRFKDSDIGVSGKAGEKPQDASYLNGVAPIFTTFYIDEPNAQMYIYLEKAGNAENKWIRAGLYRISLADLQEFGENSDVEELRSKLQLIDGSPVKYEGNATNEHVGISQFCADEDGKYLYWCYRAPTAEEAEAQQSQNFETQLKGKYWWAEDFDATNPLHQTGIKRIKLGEDTPEVEMVIPGAEGYGVVPVRFEGSSKPAGVSDITADRTDLPLTITAEAITANSDAVVVVYDMTGAARISTALRAGQSINISHLGSGAYIATANGAATKFVR